MHLVDVAGADDDLELASVEEATLEVFVVVDCCLVNLVLVLQDEAKAGCAVCGCYDVAGATDVLQHALCHLLVVHARSPLFGAPPDDAV